MEKEMPKKIKARSPQYPSIGLAEAIEKVRAIYENDYQNTIAKAVVIEHMGYSGINGKSLSVLASLGRFGLLEGRGDSHRVTDLAVRIIAHAPGTAEYVEAIKEAAKNPELFKEIDERFQGRVSETALRSYLMTQKFIPSAADSAIRSYRDTKQVVDEAMSAYRGPNEQEKDTVPVNVNTPNPQPQMESPPSFPDDGVSTSSIGVRRAVFALDEGDVVISFPKEMSAESVEDLDAYLQVFMKKARRAVGAQS